jgi:hypothetical protein
LSCGAEADEVNLEAKGAAAFALFFRHRWISFSGRKRGLLFLSDHEENASAERMMDDRINRRGATSMGPPGTNEILKPATAPHRLVACPSSHPWNHGPERIGYSQRGT